MPQAGCSEPVRHLPRHSCISLIVPQNLPTAGMSSASRGGLPPFHQQKLVPKVKW